MKKMLEYFMHDTPLYAYQKHFKDAPELEYQVNVIKHLSCGENNLAKMWWQKLQELVPSLYGDNYKYNGDYCLFSACIQKHLKMNQSQTLNLENFEGSIQEKLVFILKNSETPLTKDQLIDMPWKEEWTEESSARFNTLLSRTKKKYALDVRVRKGSYKLDKKKIA